AVSHRLTQLLDRWSGEAVIVVGRFRDVLAANALAVALNPGYRPGRNLVRDVFLDPEVGRVYADRDRIAEGAVAGLRASVGADVDAPRLLELVGELSVKSGEFRRLWNRFDVHEKGGGTKSFHHPDVGGLTLQSESFGVVAPEKQTVYVFFPERGTADEEKFAALAALVRGTSVPASSSTKGSASWRPGS
ncbi:MAG TPA: transcriptional regulator, partial [Lentzea sp.]